jgi:hypothetical protein
MIKFTKNQIDVVVYFSVRKSAIVAAGSCGRIISKPDRKKDCSKLQSLEFITRVDSKRDGYWLVK